MTEGCGQRPLIEALRLQIELGADEAIGDQPVNRFVLHDAREQSSGFQGLTSGAAAPTPNMASPTIPRKPRGDGARAGTSGEGVVASSPDSAVSCARALSASAGDLQGLQDALAGFDLCDLRHGARRLVFSDGVAGSRVMLIGEAPGADEDREGRPFVGRAGRLLDRMLAGVDLDRHRTDGSGVYIVNVVPWRPPGNRTPMANEIAMMLPFLERHVTLAAPELLLLLGNVACQAVLGRSGITRLRGQWFSAFGLPALATLHPAYLLRNPAAKREAWADMLTLKARLVQPRKRIR